jgi:hypothetical protein
MPELCSAFAPASSPRSILAKTPIKSSGYIGLVEFNVYFKRAQLTYPRDSSTLSIAPMPSVAQGGRRNQPEPAVLSSAACLWNREPLFYRQAKLKLPAAHLHGPKP